MSGEAPYRVTRYERIIAAPLFVLIYGWGVILVCALLALDRSGFAYRWFVGPHYLLSIAWALLLLVAVRLVWRRQWRFMRRRAARKRAGMSFSQQLNAWLHVTLLFLSLVALFEDLDLLFKICLGGYLILAIGDLVSAMRKRRREQAAAAS